MTKSILSILALTMFTGPVFGGASGLNIIPTADVLDKGSAAFEIERAGEQGRIFTDSETAVLLQFGLGRGIEIGYDDFGDGDSFGGWNAKLAVAWRAGSPAAAIGVQNIGTNTKAEPYAVGHIPFWRGRLHAGLIKIEDSTHPMFGYDQPLTDRLVFQTDYIEGNENAGSLGLSYNLNDGFGITAAYIRNNVGPNKDNYILTFSWFPSIF